MEKANENLSPYNQAFLDNMQEMLKDNFSKFLDELKKPAKRGLRAKSQSDIEKLYPNNKKIPWCSSACYIELYDKSGNSPLHEAGAYYIQEPSAMLPAEVLAPNEHEFILDLCAAPGGKSTQLASMLRDTGCLVANEINQKRAKILSRNIERMGLSNCVVLNNSPSELEKIFNSCFDKILVDAPCSGEGMFRKNPASRLEWNENSPKICAERQKQILSCAKNMLKAGGKILYSTCTFNGLENEEVIRDFLDKNPEFSIEKILFDGKYHDMLHIFPHEHEGEGHFLALLKSNQYASDAKNRLKKIESLNKALYKDLASFNEFLSENIGNKTLRADYFFKNSFVKLPDISFSLDGLNVLRLGLQLGQKNGKIFLLDHALSHAHRLFQHIDLNENEAKDYLNGISLMLDEMSDKNKNSLKKGYVSIMFANHCLGLGKISDGQIKNHYPKGLRRCLMNSPDEY